VGKFMEGEGEKQRRGKNDELCNKLVHYFVLSKMITSVYRQGTYAFCRGWVLVPWGCKNVNIVSI
jgi:hypothetical protein